MACKFLECKQRTGEAPIAAACSCLSSLRGLHHEICRLSEYGCKDDAFVSHHVTPDTLRCTWLSGGRCCDKVDHVTVSGVQATHCLDATAVVEA